MAARWGEWRHTELASSTSAASPCGGVGQGKGGMRCGRRRLAPWLLGRLVHRCMRQAKSALQP